MEKHTFHLENFQGPLDLLMHLLEKRKIDIYDIPIAEITDQYMEYIRTWEQYNIEVASEFLVMAATLLQIKSRLLLPRPMSIVDEEDPRQELVDKLLEYQKIKRCAESLNDRQHNVAQVYVRDGVENLFAEVEQLPDKISFTLLMEAFQRVLENSHIDANELVAEIQREEISVKRKIMEIYHFVKNAGRKVHFAELLRKNTKAEIVACFLALLELIRISKIRIEQEANCGEIMLYIKKVDDVSE